MDFLPKSEVYFVDSRSLSPNTSLVVKTQDLFEAAGLYECFNPGDKVAIKIHMGEYNNTRYLRPVFVRAIVEKVKEHGGVPFVTDTTTLPYTPFASRSTAYDHLKTVARNGFTSETVGCPIVIADGEVGTDDVWVDLPEGLLLLEQYVAKAIAEADAMIVLSHFKGHPLGTYGGAIKNVGAGCVSKRGKYNFHLANHPEYGLQNSVFKPGRCKGMDCEKWQLCENSCPEGAIKITENGIKWDREKCNSCLGHLFVASDCLVWYPPYLFFMATAVAIADSAAAVLNTFKEGKVGFINFAIDVTPFCDCVNWSDMPIVPDLGLFTSKDIVAVDTACLDLSKKSRGMHESLAEEKGAIAEETPKFTACSSYAGEEERIQINCSRKLGIGSMDYELKKPPLMNHDISNYMVGTDPVAIRLRDFYKLDHPVPKGGFKRRHKMNFDLNEIL